MIIRGFRARVHAGMEDEFERFFREQALPMVQQYAGLVSAHIGTPIEKRTNEFLMVTTWKDLDSLKEFTRDHWQEPSIDPAEKRLLQQTYLHHYRTDASGN
ncbi:antibiotic biosynthesis monooxygenase [Candidatus Acetothermia bacterium]|nr:antibiotic biosynthesis monooxygenase [Candidatus Acetothermia bacterium]MBI3642611.1 antibiotic biosynthesis monooxygenase [Candidatus Acetothermia bacterium]